MNIDTIREICKNLPHVTEDVKWGNDLCFLILQKMFCVVSLQGPLSASLKVKEEEFDELITKPGIVPAPYVAKHKWILVTNPEVFNSKEWEHFIQQSYQLIRAKLPKNKLAQLG